MVAKSLEKIKDQGQNKLHGVIIDLRDNTGGLLEQAVDVASFFIKEGNLVSVISSRAGKDIQYPSTKNVFKLKETIPMIVLINKWTASAAEILAGALKDYKRATIIGEKSFGKGSVQSFIPFEGGEAMSLTTALYKTPSGAIVENVGIAPDVEISVSSPLNKKIKDDFFLGKDIIRRATAILMKKS